ncbi:pentapeptide repeat-containing protein [Flectobacillus sp. BAB-3569]|uniref:pentapeptide repeat-containing protein n=1 Tax=Flectobacillus sp. BAB-3569 TaxID=1509483 RepID=UPI00286DA4A9|nr:pentapeptide repeat-containing protein [Flectobacillus sp. BAB-3569]
MSAKSCFFFQDQTQKTIFKDTQLQGTDFAEADLTSAIFENCNLEQAIFNRTVLEKADFRSSYNYAIDPESNRMKKAKFSVLGLAGLLQKYDLHIEG